MNPKSPDKGARILSETQARLGSGEQFGSTIRRLILPDLDAFDLVPGSTLALRLTTEKWEFLRNKQLRVRVLGWQRDC